MAANLADAFRLYPGHRCADFGPDLLPLLFPLCGSDRGPCALPVPLGQVFLFAPRLSLQPLFVAAPPAVDLVLRVLGPWTRGLDRSMGHHDDTVDWTQGDAQLTPCALVRDHCVHEPSRTNDGIHRAGPNTLRTADAAFLVDYRHGAGLVCTARRVERPWCHAQESRQLLDRRIASGWAPVEISGARRDGFGIRAAAGVTAARTLRLR